MFDTTISIVHHGEVIVQTAVLLAMARLKSGSDFFKGEYVSLLVLNL